MPSGSRCTCSRNRSHIVGRAWSGFTGRTPMTPSGAIPALRTRHRAIQPVRFQWRRVLVQTQGLVLERVDADNQRGHNVGRVEDFAPLPAGVAITGEYDSLGWIRWDVHRHLPTIVEVERLGDELAGDGHRRHLLCP